MAAEVREQDKMAGDEEDDNNPSKVDQSEKEDGEGDVYEVEKIVGMSNKDVSSPQCRKTSHRGISVELKSCQSCLLLPVCVLTSL